MRYAHAPTDLSKSNVVPMPIAVGRTKAQRKRKGINESMTNPQRLDSDLLAFARQAVLGTRQTGTRRER